MILQCYTAIMLWCYDLTILWCHNASMISCYKVVILLPRMNMTVARHEGRTSSRSTLASHPVVTSFEHYSIVVISKEHDVIISLENNVIIIISLEYNAIMMLLFSNDIITSCPMSSWWRYFLMILWHHVLAPVYCSRRTLAEKLSVISCCNIDWT